MAAGQQKRQLNAASLVSGNLQEWFRAKKKNLELTQNVLNMRSHISLEWDDNQERAVAKREQIGIAWGDLAPFMDSVSHCRTGLADVLVIPEEIFELGNVTGVLSYEVWGTHLSEKERNLLTEFLPRGMDPDKLVQALLMGENLHFGNPFLKWGSSLCSGNLHPDAVLHHEHCFKANKKAYYLELQKYQDDIVENLLRWKESWTSCKDPEKDFSQGIWRLPRKHEESSLSSHANESRVCDPKENLAATGESCSWVANEKVCTTNKQNLPIKRSKEEQERKGFVKDRHGNSLPLLERQKVIAGSRKEENPNKLWIRSGDGAKNMPNFNINRTQHQFVKRIKQSGDGIQSKSLDHVLRDIKSFHGQPYEIFEEQEWKKLHDHWLILANRDLPAAFLDWTERQLQKQHWRSSLEREMVEKNKLLVDKTCQDEEKGNSDSMLEEQSGNGESDNETTMYMQSCEDDEESVPYSTCSQPLEQIFTLNGHRELEPMDMHSREGSQDILKIEGAPPNLLEVFGNMNPTEDAVGLKVPLPSAKDLWPVVGMSDSYCNLTSVTHGYTSSSESSLRKPYPIKEGPTGLIDLESDIVEQDAGEALLHRPSNAVGSAMHINNGGSFFSSYTNQDCNEPLQPFVRGQGMLESYSYEHKQPMLQFLETNDRVLETAQLRGHFWKMQQQQQQQEQQQQLLEQRQMREKELYMHQIIQKNIYPNGNGYPVPRQELFSPVHEQDWPVDPVRVSTPLKSPLIGEELLGPNWFPGKLRAGGSWSGVDVSSCSPDQSLGNGNNDESLFSVLSQCNKLQSQSCDSMSAMEQYAPARNFMDGWIPGNNDVFPQTAHQLSYLGECQATATATLKANNMLWMNMSHQSSGLHDSTGKLFLRSWNQ